MALSRYPTLYQLSQELARLDAREEIHETKERRERIRVTDGRTATRVDVPWIGKFWLNDAQRRVVRVLMEALGNGKPDVAQDALVRASGAKVRRSLGELFAGCEAWGTLIIRGEKAATYRIPGPPDDGPHNDDRRVVEDADG